MSKEDRSDSNSDSELEESASSEKLSEPRNMEKQVITDYEKQRLSRMAENKARMEALGLRTMAASLMPSAHKSSNPRISSHRKGKRKLVYEDDDYKPTDDDIADYNDDDDDDEEEEEDADDEDFSGKSPSKSRRKKNKGTKSKNKLPFEKPSRSTGYINEDNDDELMQAIALSLQDTAKKDNANSGDGAGRRKKSQFNSRVQMTEDELILHFFQFDVSGEGLLSVRDLQRVSAAHDFTWTDRELADMIHYFDSDGDGKLNLDDFRKIAGRCNMI